MRVSADFLSLDQHLIKINLTRHKVVAIRKIATRRSESSFDFSSHHLAPSICQFLIQHGPVWPSGTLVGYCYAFTCFLQFCRRSSYTTLTAESFAAFTAWFKTAKSKHTGYHFAENTRRAYGGFLLKFMEWLGEEEALQPREIYLARARHQRAFRGSAARMLERMRLTAVSPDQFVRLIKAIRLEYEECRQLFNKPDSEQNEYNSAFPLLPFVMLLGTELAVRACEFNELNVSDLRDDRLLLNGSNKESCEVRLTPSLLAAFDLAQKWMMRYRSNSRKNDPLLMLRLKQGPRAKHLVQFDSILLKRVLEKFYAKYFEILDSEGIPLLYKLSEEDDSILLPFQLSLKGFRSAAITQAARYESDPEVVMRFARHKRLDTTLKFYIHETHKHWKNNVALCLAPTAELLRISLDSTIAERLEEKAAKAVSASVPGGHCAQVMAGDLSCRRATDCRLCPFFRIHTSKREFFARELEDNLARAEFLQNVEGLTRDAQNLRQFAALNQSIISRIDEHLSRYSMKG